MPVAQSLKPTFLVAVIFLVVGLVLHIAGMATPHWTDVDDVYQGFWEVCVEIRGCISYTSQKLDSSIRACQAFSILAILLILVAMIVCVVHVNKEEASQAGRRLYLLIASILTFFSVLCIIICLVVWRVSQANNDGIFLGYSYFLSLAGAICLLLGLFLIRLYARQLVQGSYQVLH